MGWRAIGGGGGGGGDDDDDDDDGDDDDDDDESYAVTVILHISNTDILQVQYTQHPTDCSPKHSNIRASTCHDLIV
jgi:hypothetical protein